MVEFFLFLLLSVDDARKLVFKAFSLSLLQRNYLFELVVEALTGAGLVESRRPRGAAAPVNVCAGGHCKAFFLAFRRGRVTGEFSFLFPSRASLALALFGTSTSVSA